MRVGGATIGVLVSLGCGAGGSFTADSAGGRSTAHGAGSASPVAGSLATSSVASSVDGGGLADEGRAAPESSVTSSGQDGADGGGERTGITSGSKAPTEAAEPATAHGEAARLYSVGFKTWIWPRPKAEGRFLGYVRTGQSVALRQVETVPGQRCPGGFYAIEPHGYVCNDRTVTLDADDPFLRNDAHTHPRPGAFPYDFAISNGAPMYARLPTEREARRHEWQYGKAGDYLPLPLFQRGHEHLAGPAPIPASDAIPDFIARGVNAREQRPLELFVRTIPHGSMLSYTRAFEHDGRTWLLSTDLTLVPADRVRRFRRSDHRGVALGSGVELPIAWFRVRERPAYRREADGSFHDAGKTYPARGWVALTGRSEERDGRRYLEVKGEPLWIAADDATVVERREERPFLVKPGEKWLHVSIRKGTLVAYEDLRPVFTTLVSPGMGGVPRKGGDNVKDSTTPLGSYRITFKDRAATMSPDTGPERSFWIADVPFTQYFDAPFAIHGTYWHDKLGEPMSAGCINASLLDAEWLFTWTDPPVPDGWQGATGAAAPENGPSTWVVVTR